MPSTNMETAMRSRRPFQSYVLPPSVVDFVLERHLRLGIGLPDFGVGDVVRCRKTGLQGTVS